MLKRARDFFAANNILEVDTSILSRFAVTDPNTESLSARSTLQAELFLQTSPEYKMKRLLAAGFGDIFQVCKVFRDGELGRNHLPEFTMVEWYRLDFSLQDIMRETIEFIAESLDRSDLAPSANFLSYREAFESAVQLNPSTATIAELSNCAAADEALANTMGNDRDAWLDLILADKVAATFPADILTALYHYPSSQAVLARICPADASVADRFEVYYGSLELANGFVELTDADEQTARFERDRSLRRDSGKTTHRVDREFIAALQAGLPPCAGVAAGFDRLLMVYSGESDLGAITNFVY
jgi:lysyl-tRNA synthetase class 2